MVGGVVQATTTCHQAMANRRPAWAERIASRTARATWGWQDAEWARYAGFGRRERRRRRCGGNGGHQASAASHPSGVNRGLLGRTRPRRGQRLFTCKRRDARETSLPLRCYAESREDPGLHRQPRPGDRRCVGRPPSASANAGLRRVSPAYAGQTHPGTCLEPGQRVWGARFTDSEPVPHGATGAGATPPSGPSRQALALRERLKYAPRTHGKRGEIPTLLVAGGDGRWVAEIDEL